MAITAVLLLNGKQQYLDANGKPLAGGSVTYCVPGTLTLKATWSDPARGALNTNPVALDSAGEAIIYGSGQYRQIVKDALGNVIWDELTYGQGPFPVWGDTSSGTGNAPVVTADNWVEQAGQQLIWRVGATNTGAVTLSVNGTDYSVTKSGSTGPLPLSGGELVAGNIVTGVYDSVSGTIEVSSSPPVPIPVADGGTGASNLNEFLLVDQANAIQGVGYTVQPHNYGTFTGSTLTLDGTLGQTAFATNNGPFTIAAPAVDTEIDLLLTNGASAGAVTFSGFSVGATPGMPLDTTSGHKFLISIRRINAIATYSIYALQ